jgi:hypothetical protein
MFLIRHALLCTNEDCKADLTQDGAVDVHYVVGHAEFDIPSKLDSAGLLVDNEGLIALGKHGGSVCIACNEQLDELEISPVLVDEEDGEEAPPWYVLWDGTREISGPMSKKDALDVAPFNNGFAFSGEMFESSHITEALQAQLSLLLKERISTVADLVRDLTALRTNVSVKAAYATVHDRVNEICRRAAESLLYFSGAFAQNSYGQVYVEVRSGVADVGDPLPRGITVFIDDYDVDGSGGDVELETNPETGERYHRREFKKEGT